MATQGSSELNALLKARVVKIMVELDYKNSKLPTQINKISEWLKEQGKTIKVGVKLDLTVKDFNKQVSEILTKLNNSETAKHPIKLQVQIDVKGSATQIKNQLKDVYKTVQEFNKQYGKQIQQMNNTLNQAGKKSSTQPTPFGAVDPKLYAQSLKEAETYMRSFIGTQKGLFSTTELKNANGQLKGFIASLSEANGVVNKIHYEWNADAKTFAPINQTTITETQKNTAKAKQMLMSLYADIEKLKNNGAKLNLFGGYDSLMNRKSISMNEVADLQRQIKEQSVLEQRIKANTSAYLKQEDVIRQIGKLMNTQWVKSSKDANAVALRTTLKGMMSSVKGDNSQANLQYQTLELKRINDQIELQNLKERENVKLQQQKMQVMNRISDLERKTLTSNVTAQRLIAEGKALAQNARTAQQWLEVTDKLNRAQRSNTMNADIQKLLDMQFKVEQRLVRLRDLNKMTQEAFAKAMNQLYNGTDRNLADVTRQFETLDRKVKQVEAGMRATANQTKLLFSGNTTQANSLLNLVNGGSNNINALQRYFGEMYKGKVQTLTMVETTDKLGRAVTEMKIKMEGAGKQVQTYTVQMERANGALRQTGAGLEYNANRNLGVFEQLRIAMARVPVWMVSMTAFYGTINTVKQMTSEILKLDQALTEIRRVASANISVDGLFKDSLALSKELGNNIHDILGGVAEMARTFGDFNERQLIAIERTATLMSNVSDLTAEEASNNLVGTMNAFNISAEESIHIVDAMNEVDNNYAISTKQLAEGLSKSASTAKTFNSTMDNAMENTIGHITAIGAVTMESGAIIGNSLKTIYSRLTTVDTAIESLQGVGVAIRNTSGDVRNVDDILGDLAKRWNEISDSQRQNIAIQVAGRYQLSRFLALMNNWKMAQEATNTAVHSQGSAMRENEKYMKSFEARINQLKNGFTELSSAVGDAFLSDGLLTAIEALKKLADFGVFLAHTFGAIPTLLVPISMLMLRMGLFKGTVETATKAMTQYGLIMRNSLGPANNVGRLEAMRLAWRSVTVAEGEATAGARAFGLTMKGALIETGIGAIIVGLGFAFEKLTSYIADQKRKAEETKKAMDEMVKAYRSHRDGMDSMINRYDELSKKQIKSAEEQQELSDIQKTLAKEIPTTVAYIDANGKAHMKSTEAIKSEINQVKELSKQNAKLEMAKFNDNIEKQAKNYQKVVDKIKDLNKENADLASHQGEWQGNYLKWQGWDKGFTVKDDYTDNSKKIQQNKVEILMAEAEKTEALKGTVKAIQTQSLAWLESNNMMENLTDAQQGAVEKMISSNEYVLRNAKDFKQAYVAMFQMGNDVGKIFSDATDNYKQMLKDTPELSKVMKLDDFKTQMDLVAKTIPDTFFSMTDANGKVVKSQKDITNGLKEIINVSAIAKTAGADQTNDLIYRLERTGMTAEDAQGYLWQLADSNKNLALRTATASQMTEDQVASLQDLNQEAMKAIDITGELFGFSSDELSGISSRIQAMHALEHIMGESAKTDERYVGWQMEVADALGVTTEEVQKNWAKYEKLAEGLQSIDWSKFTPDMDMHKFIEAQESLSPDTKKLIEDWGGLANIFTGKIDEAKQAVQAKAPEVTQAVQNIFDDLHFELPEMDLTRTKASIYYVEDDLGKLQKKLSDLGIQLGTPTGNEMIDGMMGHLDMTNGKLDNTQNNMLLLRGMLQAGIQTGFFDSVGAGADGSNTKIGGVNTSVDILKQKLQNPFQPNFNGVNQGVQTAGQQIDGLGQKWDVVGQAFSKPPQVVTTPYANLDGMMRGITTSAQTASTTVDGVSNKASDVAQISGDIKIVVDQAKGAKDDLEKLNSSLGKLGDGFSTGATRDELNLLGGKILDVQDKVNGLVITLLNLNMPAVANMDTLTHQLAVLSGNLALATQYGNTTAQAQQAVIDAFGRVASMAESYNNALANAGSNANAYFGGMADAMNKHVGTMYQAYMRNVNGLDEMRTKGNNALNGFLIDINSATTVVGIEFQTMASRMNQAFTDGTRAIVNSAGNLPRDIGNAIKKNMEDSSGAIQSLAKDMVRRFKAELGIHSPSRVFTEMGGHIVQGLVNGLTGHDLKSLGKDVFKDFGGGIFDSWDMIKAYLSDDFGNIAGGSAESWKMVATKALLMTNQYSAKNLQALLMQMQTESGGNPQAINLWDSNAKNGIPSKGLMQVIDPTFRRYAQPGYNKNIYDPLSNILASINYALARYGSLSNAYKGHGYAVGGLITEQELAMIGEGNKKEMVIPLEQHRNRALGLWTQAGQYLGIDPRVMAWLQQFLGKQGGGTSSGGSGSFGASSGEGGGTTGGGDSGASGTIVPSMPTIVGSTNMDGMYQMTALAGSDYTQTIADAYVSDTYKIQEEDIAKYITLQQTKQNALNKSTLEYRNTLKEIIRLNNQNLDVLKQEQVSVQQRQIAIVNELDRLPALSRQNADQREQYNKLKQEYDENLSKLNNIQTTLAKVADDIRTQSIEMFTDFIDQITTTYDSAIADIQKQIDNTQFKIDISTYISPDDMKQSLDNAVELANENQAKQATAYNKQQSLQGQLTDATNWYGANSDQAKKVREALDQANKDYQEATKGVLEAEKTIQETRGKIADDGIQKLKDYYGKMKDMATDAIEKEKAELQKEHDAKMKMYDDETQAINDIYDARSKAMDKANAEEDYNAQLADKNAKRAELVNKISLLSRDNSLEGKKKLADLQSQLADANKDLADFQKSHQRDLMKQAMDDQKQAELDAVSASKTEADTNFQSQSDALDAEKDAVSKKYDDLINDEQRWADVRDEAVKGNFTTIQTELQGMADNINLMQQGIFTNLTASFAGFSDEVKRQVAEANRIAVSNLTYETTPTVGNVDEAKQADSYTMTNGTVDSSKGASFNDILVQAPPPPPPPPPPTPPAPPAPPAPRIHTIVKGDTLWDLAREYYGNPYKWTVIAEANARPDPRKLQIGRQMVIPFDTGGFTGDWVGNDGKIAMLHKKELVLNQDQTENILDTAKIMDKLKNFVPDIAKGGVLDKLATAGTIINNITYGDISVTVEGGDKKKATDIAKEILNGIKKKGK